MTSPSVSFDPEVVALLNEAIADPDSCLFRVPRSAVSGWICERAISASLNTGGLTSSERHLAEVYREEVAWLLLEVCKKSVMELPISQTLIHRQPTLSDEALTSRYYAFRKRIPFSSAEDDLLENLATASATSLATASLRLSPRDVSRIYLARVVGLEGSPQTSRRALQALLRLPLSKPNRSYVLTGIAQDAFLSGDYKTALDNYLQASQLDKGRFPPLGCSLVSALLIGDKRSYIDASRRIEELPIDEKTISEFILLLEASKFARIARPHVTQAQRKGWEDTLLPRAWRLANALPW